MNLLAIYKKRPNYCTLKISKNAFVMTAMAVTASRRRLLPGQCTARYARVRGGSEQGAIWAGSKGWKQGTRGREHGDNRSD
jgi:hypothetical protein